jgi:hypothetical protein
MGLEPMAFDWAVVEALQFEPLYDAARALELMVAVGPPSDAKDKAEKVAARLSLIGFNFAFDLWRESRPSVTDKQAEALRLAAALRVALEIVGVGEDEPTLDNLHPTFGPGGLFGAAALRGEPSGKAATMNNLRALHLLRLDALRMAEQAGKSLAMKAPATGRPTSRAISGLVRDLAALYFDVWEWLPAISRAKGSNAASGPLVRLMVPVADALRARGCRFYASGDSLAQYWRRLPADEKLRLDTVKTVKA